MDEGLYKATIEGNTESLIKLIQQDALILDRNTITTTYLETPLHIAAMLGHEQFAIELLKRKPGLARELDSRRSSALHVGSAKGDVGIVKALLLINPDMCFACDRDGKNPLHIAAMMGRIDALKEMLRVKPDAARVLIDRGGTILHLCVEYCQFEGLKLLVEHVNFQDLMNSKDKNGNTILHLAVADKQAETTEFLLSVAAMDCNALNLSGMTAMDILIQRRRDARDLEIEESLKRAGACGGRENMAENRALLSPHPDSLCSCRDIQKTVWKKLLKNHDDWLEKKRSALMVVASLIATMAFQVGVNPPSNVWTETKTQTVHSSHLSVNDPNGAMHYLTKPSTYYIINTTSFVASLSIILLLMSGLPLKLRVFVRILMVITWIAITAIALSYTVSLVLSTPSLQKESIDGIIVITVYAWIFLMALLLLSHTIRLFVKIVKMLLNMVIMLIKCLFGRRMSSGSAVPRNNVRV
ncbi:hypothetical protein Pfo_001518 [Paulownia fortunei]|nr:hypothetical protein Pfo_001518 [Paulownia fortunei]